MQEIRYLEFTHLITERLYPLTNIPPSPILLPSEAGNYLSTLILGG